MQQGISGKIANFFINSKLTILLMVALMVIGSYSSMLIPREEEPQINVPMADIMVGYPGASPSEVETRVIKPLEKIISNIKGVEHIHAMAMNGQAMIVVQFYVGEDTERSYVKLYDELMKHEHEFPKTVMKPMVKTRSIDNVPMLGLTLWSEKYSDFELRQMAEEVSNEIKKIKDVSITKEIGGRSRVLSVVLDKEKLAENKVDALGVAQLIQAHNSSSQSGSFNAQDQEFLVTTGRFIQSAQELGRVVVGVNGRMPVYLEQVAEIVDGPASAINYVSFGYGPGHESSSF
jgi:multidrug efflux pump subunit AcrB